jgi:hypothetical protein
MNSVLGFLESIEKLALKVLLWIILIPKTLLKIIFDPDWVPEYSQQELGDDVKVKFDEYISPIFLLLLVAVIPAVFLNIGPQFGVEIVQPGPGFRSTERAISFEAKANSVTNRDRFLEQFEWIINKKEEGHTFRVYSETHKTARVTLDYIDTVTDDFYYEFTDAGEYSVLLLVTFCTYASSEVIDTNANEYPDRFNCGEQNQEAYFTALSITIPENLNEQVNVHTFVDSFIATDQNNMPIADRFAKELQSQRTIFIALGLLIPPLLFSVATKLFREGTIGESTLRNNFYTQCYYFSPVILAIWATFYANYFWTRDIWGASRPVSFYLFLIPLVLASFWLLVVETNEIARGRNIGKFKSFMIALLCILLMLSIGYFLSFKVSENQDAIRRLLLRSYPVIGVILALLFMRSRKRKGSSKV